MFNQRPRGWQHYSEESESESHTLLSSGASAASHSSYGPACMFPDSETSDQDNPRPAPPAMRPAAAPRVFQPTRRPFTGASTRAEAVRRSLDEQLGDVTLNRLQYYSKLRAHADPASRALVIPDHVVPASLFVGYCSGREGEEPSRNCSLVTIFSIWNTIMGSSLLAMPWGFAQSGLAAGLLVTALTAALCLYTALLLLRVDQRQGAAGAGGEVAALCRQLLGPRAERAAQFFSLLVLLGADIVYWVLMSSFLFHCVDSLHVALSHTTDVLLSSNQSDQPSVLCHHNHTDLREQQSASTFRDLWDLDSTVPVYLVVIVGPLVNFRSASFFTKFNSLGALSAVYLVVYVLCKGAGWGPHLDLDPADGPGYAPQFLPTFPALSGMLALSFFIHNIVVTIMHSNRHQEHNTRDLSIAYMLVTLTYVLIGAVFYICFPLAKSCIKDNMLDNFHSADTMTTVARVFLFFQLVTVFPLITYMLRTQFFAIFLRKSCPTFAHILAFNIAIVLVCVLFAIYLPRIGTIIRFTGATSGLVYVFTLPSLLHLASQRQHGKATWLSTALHLAIPVAGGANLLAQFFVHDL
ncbi:neutral amino acid transporter 9-like [Bacillus rossius redtenbacheri]|uniref:neutral amino acid transporter 9-like n=1 Tax=Bacillus rossius redtenbacheri TaxID=93214 RepID=UPI002FDE517D